MSDEKKYTEQDMINAVDGAIADVVAGRIKPLTAERDRLLKENEKMQELLERLAKHEDIWQNLNKYQSIVNILGDLAIDAFNLITDLEQSYDTDQ